MPCLSSSAVSALNEFDQGVERPIPIRGAFHDHHLFGLERERFTEGIGGLNRGGGAVKARPTGSPPASARRRCAAPGLPLAGGRRGGAGLAEAAGEAVAAGAAEGLADGEAEGAGDCASAAPPAAKIIIGTSATMAERKVLIGFILLFSIHPQAVAACPGPGRQSAAIPNTQGPPSSHDRCVMHPCALGNRPHWPYKTGRIWEIP